VVLSTVLNERVHKVAKSHEGATVETDIPDGLRVTGDDLVGQVIDKRQSATRSGPTPKHPEQGE